MKLLNTSLIIFSISLLSIQNIYSQKITKNEIDDFTNKKVIETSWAEVNGFMFRIRKIDNTLVLDQIYDSNTSYLMDVGDELLLKLENDEIVKLISDKFVSSNAREYFPGMLFNLRFENSYTLGQTQLKQLQNSLLLKFRWHTLEKYYDYEVRKNQSKRLLKMFSLIKVE